MLHSQSIRKARSKSDDSTGGDFVRLQLPKITRMMAGMLTDREPRGLFSGGKRLCCISAVAASLWIGCGNADLETPPTPSDTGLFVDPADYDFSENPALLDRVKGDPHGYFRFINIPFSNAVCRRWSELLDPAPRLNLHGDAHLEQYAVTDLGRGLTDFDDSSTGPGFLDLMRFGVSLKLTCAIRGWENDFSDILDNFLNGYHDALLDPQLRAPEPAVVKQIRQGFTSDREAYFKWVDSVMEPMPPEFKLRVVEALQPYVEGRLTEDPQLDPDFFRVVEMGFLKLGIGSALDLKFLIRVRGPGPDPLDDAVLEVKEVRNLEGIACIQAGVSDPFRILLSQARIAYAPFRFLGYLRMQEGTFWVHSWVENYRELDIHETFSTPGELAEVAYDVGVQLGLGHPKQIGAPFGAELRHSQWLLLEDNKAGVVQSCDTLAEEVTQAWKAFREAAS